MLSIQLKLSGISEKVRAQIGKMNQAATQAALDAQRSTAQNVNTLVNDAAAQINTGVDSVVHREASKISY